MSTGIIIAGADGFCCAADECSDPGQEEYVRLVPLLGEHGRSNGTNDWNGAAIVAGDSPETLSRVVRALSTGGTVHVPGKPEEVHQHIIRVCSSVGTDVEFFLIYGGFCGTVATSGRIAFSSGIAVQDEIDTPERWDRIRVVGDRHTVHRLIYGVVPAFQTLILRKIQQEAGRFYGMWLRDRERYYDSILKQIASSAETAEKTIDAALQKHNASAPLRDAISTALDSIDYHDPLDTPFSECMKLVHDQDLETEEFFEAMQHHGIDQAPGTIVPGPLRYQHVDRPIKEEEHEILWDKITVDAKNIAAHEIEFEPETMGVSELIPVVRFLMNTSREARQFLSNNKRATKETLTMMVCSSSAGCTWVTDDTETD